MRTPVHGRRFLRTGLLVALLAGGLAGCGEFSLPTLTPPPIEAPAPKRQIATVPPKLPAKTQEKPQEKSRPPALVDPERLVGLDAAGLHDALGTPATIDSKGPAEVWQYRVGECLLRFYLYADIGTGARRTLRYDTAPAPGAPKGVDCKPPLKGSVAHG